MLGFGAEGLQPLGFAFWARRFWTQGQNDLVSMWVGAVIVVFCGFGADEFWSKNGVVR